MNKAHSSIDWENYPSGETPLNERNLNKMDSAIELIDDRVIALDATKAAKTEVAALVADVTFEESTGIFTITKKNGSQITIDTKMEKIAVNFTYNPTTQQIILTLIDGTKQYIDLSALITQYEFLDTDTVAFVIGTDGKVSSIVKEGSIGERHLEPNYLAKIKVEAAKAQTSASNAAASEENAAASAESARASEAAAAASESSVQANATAAATSEANAAASAESARASEAAAAASESSAIEKATSASESATIATEKADVATQKASEIIGKAESAAESATKAESYAVGGTGSREGEDLDNAKYYYHQAKSISESFSGALRPMGTVTFDALPPIETATAGDMYNVSDQFITTDDFKEGAGNVIPAGANIYKTSDDKWDVLAGTPVTGIKGANETIYRRGNVNLTADDVGSYAKESIDAMMEKVSLSLSDYLDEIQSDGMVIHSQNWTTVNYLKSISSSLDALVDLLDTKQPASTAITTSNIGNQSVKYAESAGSAERLGASAGSAAQPVYFKDGKPVAGSYILADACARDVKTAAAVTDSGYGTNNDKVPDLAFLAFWNGAFNNAGKSNLRYCNLGAFGTIVTKNVGDYLALSGGTLTGKLIINNGVDIGTGGGFLSSINLKVVNNKWLASYTTSGSEIKLIGMNNSDNIHMGDYGTTNISPVFLHAEGNQYNFYNGNFRCNVSNKSSLGTSGFLWTTVYAKTGSINTSDKTKKHDIKDLTDVYEQLFLKLQPKSFVFNDGDRVHIGAISQDVEEAMQELGIEPEQFAGFCKDIRYEYTKFNEEDGMPIESSKAPCKDEDGNVIYDYALRYQEFIFLTIHMVQKLWNKAETLEEENKKLWTKMEQMEARLAALEKMAQTQ